MTRAIIYMRKSRDEENNGVYSFDYQERDCRTYADQRSHNVVQVLKETEETGHDSLDIRPVLQELRNLIRTGQVDVVLVWRYDRLARDFLDQAVLMREGRNYNVVFESVTEPVPDGPMGHIMRAIIGGMSEQEWQSTRQRLQAAVHRTDTCGPIARRRGSCQTQSPLQSWCVSSTSSARATRPARFRAFSHESASHPQQGKATGVTMPCVTS
jgi:hypothetical protein